MIVNDINPQITEKVTQAEIQSMYFDENFKNVIASSRCLVGDLISIKTDNVSPTKTKGYVVKTIVNEFGETMIGVSQDNRICYDLESGEIVETPIKWYSRERLDDDQKGRYKLQNIGYKSSQRQLICVRDKDKNGNHFYRILQFLTKSEECTYEYYNMDDETLIDIYARKDGYNQEVLPWLLDKDKFFYKQRGCYVYVPETKEEIDKAKEAFDNGDKNVVKITDLLSLKSHYYIRPKFKIDPKNLLKSVCISDTSFESFVNENKDRIKEMLKINDDMWVK